MARRRTPTDSLPLLRRSRAGREAREDVGAADRAGGYRCGGGGRLEREAAEERREGGRRPGAELRWEWESRHREWGGVRVPRVGGL